VAFGEFFAEGVDSVLRWSGTAGDSAVSWEAVTSVVCESFGDGFGVPAGAGFGDLIVYHFHDVREFSGIWFILSQAAGGEKGDGEKFLHDREI